MGSTALFLREDEQEEFSRLPDEVSHEVRETVTVLMRLDRQKKLRPAANREARHYPGRRGFSGTSLLRKYYLWKSAGCDWRVLVDQSRVRADQNSKQPAEFISFWQSLIDENHRKIKPAWRKLIRLWRAGEAIPGYGRWTEWFLATHPGAFMPQTCPPDLPQGWTYKNLSRYRPEPAELTLTRRGVASARLELPSVIGTREGLRPLEWIVLDDWRSDFRVIAGGSQPAQLNGVLALDVSSALALRFGLRPALARDDGSEEGIKRRDVKALVAGILANYGYPSDYVCNIICERGTATITPDDAAAIEEVTSGHVVIHYTSMIGGNLFGYADRPVGNFLGKAWLESYFNLVHNEAADLPGQMGSRYELAPGELHGRMEEAKALIKAGQFLPPELRRKMALPFLNIYEAKESMEMILRRLNHRADHRLEAFEEVLEWREKALEQWRPAHDLAGVSAELADCLIYRKRLETPLERFHRLAQGMIFTKIHHSCLPRILEEHRTVTVQKPGEIAFEILGKRRIWRDLDNAELTAGSEFLAYYDAQDPAWIHLTNAKGAYVASLPEVKAVRRDDAAALKEAIGAKHRQLANLMERVRTRNADRLSNRLEQATENVDALEDAQAVDLVPAYAGATEHAPVVAAAIGAVDQARAERRKRKAETARRVEAEGGSLGDLIPEKETPDDQEFDGAADGLDQLFGN